MPLTARRLCARLALAVVLAAALTGAAAAAAGPFGVGLPEPAPSGGGWFPSLFAAIAGWQSSFYRELTATLALAIRNAPNRNARSVNCMTNAMKKFTTLRN